MDKIVLIEDDPGIRTVIRLALKGAGFTSIYEAGNGTDGLALVQREKPALVLLDLMLPGMDGLAVCNAIRRTPSVSGTPIVMLTARTAEEDVVRGLELGADDYITKPFSNAILVARVKAALRRTAPPTGPVRTLGLLVLDETTRTASVDGVMLSLTRSEFDLLDILSAHPCRVYTRQQIIARIQREEKDVTDRTVDTLMVGLRRKLGEWAEHVETIRGIGYRITP
ncbi:MAG: response regulator transcription factor [Kiritimatiellae bacterium]|nr:response regulator transcription factor [Kiritimatiellia bacterium]